MRISASSLPEPLAESAGLELASKVTGAQVLNPALLEEVPEEM